jgi:Outer membrane protein
MKSLSLSAPALSSRAAVAAAVTALALTGCANYFGMKSDKQISSPAQYESAQSLSGQGGQWPSLDWAGQFGDPQLPRLIAEALEGSPSIAQAQARLAKASSYIESSRSALYPKVNGSYSWNRELFSENALYPPPYGGTWYSENNVLASASWDLDLWGKNRQRLGQAVSQEKGRASRYAAGARDARRLRGKHLQPARPVVRVPRHRRTRNRQPPGCQPHHQRPRERRPRYQRRTGNRERQHCDQPAEPDRFRRPDHVVRYQLGALLGKGPDRGLQIAKPVLTTATR